LDSSQLQAGPPFFKRRAEGWHWYENFSKEKEPIRKREKKKGYVEKSSPSPQTPTKIIEEQRKALEQKLHAAIIEPSRKNITSYLIAQRALMDQSQKFAESWKEVVMNTPSLDETLTHPVDQNARHVYYQERQKTLTHRIKALAKEFGLFFFFKETCTYCHGLAPIVKRFSEKYGWAVLAISLDGAHLPEFPHAKRDNGTAERLSITHLPALVAVHPETQQIIPLAYGLISESEIEERIELLTRVSQGALHHPSESHLQRKEAP
jgi:conjugal transfer pilus assembly protein TraF